MKLLDEAKRDRNEEYQNDLEVEDPPKLEYNA